MYTPLHVYIPLYVLLLPHIYSPLCIILSKCNTSSVCNLPPRVQSFVCLLLRMYTPLCVVFVSSLYVLFSVSTNLFMYYPYDPHDIERATMPDVGEATANKKRGTANKRGLQILAP